MAENATTTPSETTRNFTRFIVQIEPSMQKMNPYGAHADFADAVISTTVGAPYYGDVKVHCPCGVNITENCHDFVGVDSMVLLFWLDHTTRAIEITDLKVEYRKFGQRLNLQLDYQTGLDSYMRHNPWIQNVVDEVINVFGTGKMEQ